MLEPAATCSQFRRCLRSFTTEAQSTRRRNDEREPFRISYLWVLCASVVLNSFQDTNHFDLGGLREHVEGLNFLNPEPVSETL
jgi:hypothetical protein